MGPFCYCLCPCLCKHGGPIVLSVSGEHGGICVHMCLSMNNVPRKEPSASSCLLEFRPRLRAEAQDTAARQHAPGTFQGPGGVLIYLRALPVCSHGREHRGTPGTCGQCPCMVPSGLLRGKNPREHLLGTPGRKKHPAGWGSGSSKQGEHRGSGSVRSVSQAAMLLTLLWVTGHRPEKESVYHVGIRAILDSPQ